MTSNPLSKYYRRPAMFVSLPTKGMFNPEIETTALDEIGVLPMTAMDEITMKNPDALLNGEALISLIKSCVPSIPNPRNLCTIDMEALYLAIRYATFGKEMTFSNKCTKCGETNDFNLDINYLLNRFPEFDEVPVVEHEDIKIYLRPPTVESTTRRAMIELEQSRIIESIRVSLINDEGNKEGDDVVDDEEISRKFYNSYIKIAKYNIDMISNVINYIETPDGERVSDHEQINEFINNVHSSVVDQINKKIKDITKKPKEVSEFEVTCPECSNLDKISLETNPVNFSEAG